MEDEQLSFSPDRKKEESIILRVAWYSLFVNIFLVAAKLYIAFFSGSLSVQADAINSFIDIFVSLVLIAGIRLSGIKSKNFPYGMYKVENLISIIISLLVFLTAWEVFTRALFEETGDLSISGWVLAAVFALAFVPYLLGRYEIIIGERYSSPGLIADGKQHNMDVLSTMTVFFALFVQYAGYGVDNIGAIIVAGFIAYAGWDILKDSMKTLLDASVDYRTRDLIKSAILSDPMVSGIKELNARNSGRYIFVEATVDMIRTDLLKAHLASERIESEIKNLVPSVERVIIHYEPKEKPFVRYIVPLEDNVEKISCHFGESAFFAVLDFSLTELRLREKKVYPNPFLSEEKQKGIRFAEHMMKFNPDNIVLLKDVSKKSFEYVFSASGVDVKRTELKDMSKLVLEIESVLRKD
ncbi:MAG: cation diffusion facilitator family transporter [Methanomicrobium sp.]|nr:cation diffusion facilitator family transporter [Methanomicrobium sp.]